MSDIESPASLHEESDVEADVPAEDSPLADDNDGLDDDSDLSEVDEAQFDNFDPTAVDRPQPVDAENIRAIGVHKRKRTTAGSDGDDREERRKESKRKKDAKARKPKRSRKSKEELEAEADDHFSGGEQLEGKRTRKSRGDGERRTRTVAVEEDDEQDENLTPEERRRRALENAITNALRNPNQRRARPAGIDLDKMLDKELMDMRNRMTTAAALDAKARENKQPAMNKLMMLPEVVGLLNRNNLRNQIVDPDINLLEAVRFFLEPLGDGSLPAYNIQRELFASLARLPMTKDTLVASGIGKVILFYTRSKKVEPRIKVQAERLARDWMRLILKRPDDYRKRGVAIANIDMNEPISSQISAPSAEARARAAREKALALPVLTNRARVEGGLDVYTVAPRTNLDMSTVQRQPGQSGEEAFRRLKLKHQMKGQARR